MVTGYKMSKRSLVSVFCLMTAILFCENQLSAQNNRLENYLRRTRNIESRGQIRPMRVSRQVMYQENAPKQNNNTQSQNNDDEQRKPYQSNQVQRFKSINEIDIDIRDRAKLKPKSRPLMVMTTASYQYKKDWADRVVSWAAPNIRYQPLYFEHVSSERYGQTYRPVIQSAVNSAHFFGSLITVPKKWIQQRPFQCVSPLGYCRPGNLAPYTRERQFLPY